MTARGFRFVLSPDTAANMALFRRGFHEDEWVGDHHTFWRVETTGGEVAGFCSAVVVPGESTVFLSSACVFRAYRGANLQRAMIRHRLRWAKRRGVTAVLTYTVEKNWPSAANLLREGFRVYEPAYPWVGKAWYFQRAA